jgi:hypothetical protein
MATTTDSGDAAGPAPAYAVPGKTWAARRVGGVLFAGMRERLHRGTAVDTADVPRSPDEITAEWLTAVLCADTPGARVVNLTMPGGSVGSTSILPSPVRANGRTPRDPDWRPRSRGQRRAQRHD